MAFSGSKGEFVLTSEESYIINSREAVDKTFIVTDAIPIKRGRESG